VSKLIRVLAGRGERRTITILKLVSLAIGIVLASVIVALLSFGGGEASTKVGVGTNILTRRQDPHTTGYGFPTIICMNSDSLLKEQKRVILTN
jgi:hypothetical protein